jgi:hypothetical protein
MRYPITPGWPPQNGARRAAERDEDAIASIS